MTSKRLENWTKTSKMLWSDVHVRQMNIGWMLNENGHSSRRTKSRPNCAAICWTRIVLICWWDLTWVQPSIDSFDSITAVRRWRTIKKTCILYRPSKKPCTNWHVCAVLECIDMISVFSYLFALWATRVYWSARKLWNSTVSALHWRKFYTDSSSSII